jgi:RNA polymerase sigma-70 factor, ECF subfamily
MMLNSVSFSNFNLNKRCFYSHCMTTKAIWKLYAQDLKHFILSKVKDDTVTDDLLQDTFIKIHTKHNGIRDDSKLKAWVFSIARYTVYDYFRKNRLSTSIDKEELLCIEETKEGTHTEQDCLRGIIKNLPKKYRTPLFLADIKGMKQAKIAQELELPLPTVKSQIQRARTLITKGFMECCGFKLNDEGYLVGELQDKADCKVCAH